MPFEFDDERVGGGFVFDDEQQATQTPAKKRGITGVADDLAKGIGGSAVSAVGMVPTAIGRMVQEGGEKLFGLSMDEAKRMADAEGAPDKALEWYEKSNRLNPISIIGRGIQGGGEWIGEQGEKLRDARSEQAKEKARQSTPDGDITKPSTWTMGEDPSIEGVLQVGADVMGSMAPPIAAAIATRGRSAATQMRAGGAVVAGQIGGAAMGEAGEYLGQFSDEQLRQASPVFRKLEADGYSAADARTLVQREAENTAAAFAAPVGYVGGKATAALLGKPGEKLAGGLGSTAAKAGVLAVLGATEEGLQEVAEGVATRAGINKGAGTSRSLTEGTFGEFVLGAKAGGVTGAGKGLLEGMRGQDAQAGPPQADPATDPNAAPDITPETETSPQTPAGPEPTPDITPQSGDPTARLAELELISSERDLTEPERQEAAGLFEALQADEDAQNLPTPLEAFDGQDNPADPFAAQAGTDAEPGTADAAGGQPVPPAQGQELGALSDEQNAPQPAAGTQAQAAPGEAPAPAGRNAAPASGIPDAPGAGDVQAAGLNPRENVIGQAVGAAQRVLQNGGTEADANRAATDALIAGMGLAPDIAIAQDAPAAVQAARAAVESAPILPPLQAGPDVNLQNRDRGRAASVVQMTEIARNPDYMRLGPSRTPDSGAPMVFAVADDTAAIPPENFGRQDVAVMSDGQQVGFRYAVADATKVNPSNFADGRTNETFSSDLPGTIKALNNGRTAGVRAAHEMGTAGQYVEAMQGDAQMHGISPDVIARTPNPILVRVYADGDNTAGMAAKSQGQGLGMSPSELARQDAPLMDASVLGVYQPGDVTSAANRDFVRAFVGKLQGAGQDVAAMMTGNGELSQDGRKRIQAALMQAAYGDADLVDEMFDSTDTDIKAIGEALKAVAGEWANMRDSARLGAISPDADVTENLLQTLGLIRKSRRDRMALTDLVNQPDLLTGQAPDATTVGMLRLFYDGQYLTRAVGRDRLSASLTKYVRAALSTSAEPGMFGDVVTPDQILAEIAGLTQGTPDAQIEPQNSRGEPTGGSLDRGGPGGGQQGVGQPVTAPGGPGPDQSSQPEPQQNQDQAEQQNGKSDQGRAEGEGEGARGGVKPAPSKPKAKKPPKATEPRTLLESGRASDGQPINAGDVFNTSSGRKTTGYPKQAGQRFASQWLINNAILEAEARGDGMNMAAFSGEKPLKDGTLPTASRESLLMYLFGEQPVVVPSILKPLAGRTDTGGSAQDFVRTPGGGLDYGEITPEMGKAMRRQAGKIRLQRGDSSFGLQHIEERHGKEILAAGFASIEDFVLGAVSDIESVWQPAATSQLVVVQATERGRVVFIQLQAGKDEAGDFYTVRTAFPSSRSYAEKRKEWKKLWSRVPVPAADAGTSASSAEPGKEAGSKSAMDSSQSSADSVPPVPGAAQTRQGDLTAPTRADIEAQQERAEQAERDRVAADKAAAAREAKERERADVKRLSESAADTFELGGDPMANLTGQKDIFGGDPEPEPAPTADDLAKAKAADDLKNALGDLADIFGKDFKANMLPEQEQKLLPVLTRVMDAAFRLGYLSFKDAAKYALDQIRAALGQPVADAISLEHLQGAYIGMSGRYKEQGADNVRTVSSTEDKAEIEKHTARVATPKEKSNVPSADGRVERNSPEPAAEPAVGDAVSPGARSAADGAGPSGGSASGAGGRGQRDGAGLPAGGTAAGGNRGDFGLPGGNAPVVSADSLARDQFGERSGGIGFDGVPPEPVPAAQVDAVAQGGNEQLSKEQRQRAAQKVPVKLGDIENIRATLPYLLEGQQDDVRMAEAQFAKPEGYGMLFTNGTGTGKTFSGLGIVKRFERQGKTNTLIVVPDDKIAADWMKSGAPLSLPISKLADTKTAGKGIVVTTYANLGANDELARRDWDLVVADEAHTLMQSADGKVTSYLENLRAITLHPDGASSRWAMLNREDIAALRELNDRIDANDKILSNPDTMDAMVTSLRKENERLQDQRAALNLKLNDARDAIKADVEARQGLKRTRLVALSATPFAYEFTIDWANGYLFDYNEGRPSEKNTFRGYNEGSNREQFFMQHFGYSMRTNKLTRPDPSKVDTGMLQRQFNGYLKKRGSLSGRMLDVQADYDRRFVLVESAIGNDIDAALSWVSEQARAAGKGEGGFSMLRQVLDDKFDYLSRRYLLEAIKATESVAIVKQHLAMGRKVVVFHDYKKGGGFNPFDLQPLGAGQADPSMDPQTAVDLAQRREQFNAAVKVFRAKFKGLVDAPLGRMASPIEVFKREFADVLLINGDEKKRDLLERYDRFQDDASGPLVALVQSDKNKGWSGHDTTGKHQRVLINLGQPTAPTRAIQQEGRIYRTGQVSNAIMRYLNTGTNWEKWAFATTIAGRASTAENLGMGELSRALKDSFIAAFEESDAYPPGHEGEGTGGKERDKAQNNALSAWDRAKTFYWATQKKNSRTKAREGVDYFATPEPVGLKMVEWLGLRGGEDSLEPSAGHGAIARWLPETSNRTVIEPSDTLRARLAMAMDAGKDRIIDDTFENHNVVNKYDGIAMNPPFGVGGKTAIEHLAKAATHLRDGGRIVALIPTGPAADKRFEKWMYEKEQRPVKPLGTVLVGGKETPIYKGDTVESRASWAPAGTVVGLRDGGVLVKASAPEFRGVAASLVSVESIKSVQPTGARTEGFSPAAGLYLVADIQMPASTFERAGTAVMTRIVVIEKQLDAARAPNQRNRDLSDIEDINALFDRLEDLSLPPRAMTASQETSAKAEQAAEDARAKKDQPQAPKEPKAAKAPKAAPTAPGSRITLGGKEYTVEVYTTNGGKDLSGVWVATRAEALSYGPSTFEKRGKGFFVRERDFKGASNPGAAGDEPAGGVFSTTAQKPAQSVTVQRAQEIADTIYNDLGIGAKSRAKVFGNPVDAGFRVPASVVPQGATRNGDVFLFAENLADELAVFGTVFHELFHLGLSKSVSQGAYIQTMLGFLSDPLVRQYAQRWKQSEDGVSRKTTMPMGNWQALAVEEALSDIAEEMNVSRGGMGTKYGNWVSSMAALMARLATRMRLKGVAERIRAMTRTQAEAFVQVTMRRAGSTDPVQLRDTRFASQTLGGGTPTPPPGPPSTWQKLKSRVNELTSPQALDSLVYEYQDKLVDLKRIRQHIKDIGGTITDLNDAYLGEELYHKRVAKRTQDFLADELKPLQADMRARGVTMEAFERFLHARHAPEANAAMAERNPTQTTIDTAKAAADAQVRSLERLLQTATRAGTATKALNQALEQARAERARWTGAQAFKGTEAERLSLSGMSDQEATSLMTGLSPRERADLDALAARVDAMNAATMSTLERYGLMDRPSLDAWRKAYQFYVPLHRDEAHPDSTSHPIGQGFSTKGEASKRRTGSNAKVTNILGHIAMQREAALTRGEKNMVAKKLYLMAAQNPDPALWSVDKPPTVKTVDRETGLVRTNVDPTFKNKPNVVMVRIAGKDASITFNERNPQAVRLAESIKNLDMGDLGALTNIVAKGTRWLASVNTQYNPIFGLVNFTRDVQGAALQLSSTPIAGQERRVIADTPKALRAIYGEVRKRRGGAPAGTDPWVKLWEELQNEGGTTGYRELFMKPEERVKELEKQLNALDRGQVSQAAHAVVDWLSDFNEAIENGVRLATYKAALDQGLSKPRAASIAKNITVNFNRRGRQTAKLGAYYAFLNAAIQGTTRMVETLKGPAGKKIMLGGVMLGALNTLLGIAMMGGDDEDDEDNWEKIPDFVKERNVIIPLGREDYLTIPMPLGFNVLPNIGRKAVEMMLHDDPTVGRGRHVAELMRIVLDSFNPFGGSENLGQMAMPTVFDPALALYQNRDWTGKQIYREDMSSLDPTPGFTRTKDSATFISKGVAEALNKITFGTDYQPGGISWTPDQIEYVFGQLTGGIGREAMKVVQTLSTPFTGEELPSYKIPIVGRLYGNTSGPANHSEKFYENVRQLNMVENEIRGRASDGEDVDGYLQKEPLAPLVGVGNAAESQLRKLRAARRAIIARGLDGYTDQVREINEMQGQVMQDLNRQVRDAKRAAQ